MTPCTCALCPCSYKSSFMEVSVGVCETCVLLVFLLLTQITEQYLDKVTAEAQGRERRKGAGFPIILDGDKSTMQKEDTTFG